MKLKVLEVGVCGTDKELCSFLYGTPPEDSEYLIIGHESLAQIVEVGKEVTDFAVGDLAVIMVRRPCPHEHCLPCRQGHQDFCSTGDFSERGINGLHGFMTEYVVDEARYICKVPATLRDIAVLTEPLTIAEKAFQQYELIQTRTGSSCKNPEHNHQALVLGAGPVALLGAMLLMLNAFTTTVYSRELSSDERTKLVEAMGAVYFSSEEQTIEELQKQIGGVDLLYEAIGVSEPAFKLLTLLNANGVSIFTGIPGKNAVIPTPTDAIMKDLVLKNQLILGTVNAGKHNFTQAILDLHRFMEKWPGLSEQLLTQRVSVLSPSLQDVLLGKEGGIKNIITLSSS